MPGNSYRSDSFCLLVEPVLIHRTAAVVVVVVAVVTVVVGAPFGSRYRRAAAVGSLGRHRTHPKASLAHGSYSSSSSAAGRTARHLSYSSRCSSADCEKGAVGCRPAAEASGHDDAIASNIAAAACTSTTASTGCRTRSSHNLFAVDTTTTSFSTGA